MVLIIETQKQKGIKDGGVFAIVTGTTTVHGADPTRLSFDHVAT